MTASRRALTIAGVDSGGGAGVAADLRAFARLGVFGTVAVTAVTAQDTTGVHAVHPIPAEVVARQIRAVVEDIGVDAVKIGMLANAEIASAVVKELAAVPLGVPIVVDPVLVSSTGAALLDGAGVDVLVNRLIPRATVITPNIDEAAALLGCAPASDEAMLSALRALGPNVVVLTGGHRSVSEDLFDDGNGIEAIAFERLAVDASHGTGCTHSAALAGALAWGTGALEAARIAQAVTGDAIRHGHWDLGAGPGPVDALAGEAWSALSAGPRLP